MFFRNQQFMVHRWIILCGLIAVCGNGFGQDKSDYIEQYKDIAIAEMYRSGIPASIKLAQAMLESNCGKSELACKANNHFGIKCGNDWKGKSYKKEDDDYENGNLIKSCFREYRTPFDSYVAHSDFLMDPGKSKRYGFLFDLDNTDYTAWAKGLSKAGYATDPHYAKRLIDLIEQNELFLFDSPYPDELARNKPKSSLAHDMYKYHNDVRYVLASMGDTPESLANQHDVTPNQIVRYNDDIDDRDQALAEGSRVYLQPKRNQYRGNKKTHLLKPDETMITVSQLYGIKLETLLRRNGLQSNDVPASNQKIVIKGKSKTPIRTIDPYEKPEGKPSIPKIISTAPDVISQEPHYETTKAENEKQVVEVVEEISIPKPQTEEAQTSEETVQRIITEHTVTKGDTLYSIARQHQISLDELKKMNNLSADTIFIGQKLLVK